MRSDGEHSEEDIATPESVLASFWNALVCIDRHVQDSEIGEIL